MEIFRKRNKLLHEKLSNSVIYEKYKKYHYFSKFWKDKAFQLPFFSFFFSSFLALFLEGLAKAFVNVSSFIVQSVCDQDRVIELNTLARVYVTILIIVEFRVCGYGIHDIHVRI